MKKFGLRKCISIFVTLVMLLNCLCLVSANDVFPSVDGSSNITQSGGSGQTLFGVKAAYVFKITNQTADHTLYVGDEAIFKVEGEGLKPLTAQWYKDGVAIGEPSQDGILTIPSVTLEDTGSYTVSLTDAKGNTIYGVDFGFQTLLTVVEKNKPVELKITKVEGPTGNVYEGNDIKITATIEGVAPFTYQWYKDGVIIEGATDSIYVKEMVETTDSGKYTIVVSDAYGNVVKSEDFDLFADVKVTTAPSKPSGGGGGGGGGGGFTAPEETSTETTTEASAEETTQTPKDELLNTSDHIRYIAGYPDNTVKPNRNITRAEVAAIFARLMKNPPEEGKNYKSKFTDVPMGRWYSNYIGYLEKYEILTGYPDGTFQPDKFITRAEFATISSKFDELNKVFLSQFKDVKRSHWAFSYINSAAKKGCVSGYPDGTFKPDKNITRAETVSIVNRMLQRTADKDYVDKSKYIKDFVDMTNKSYWAYYPIMEASYGHSHTKDANGNETWHTVYANNV